MTTYKIVRFYRDDNKPSEVIKAGLTLEEAQAHCNDPATRHQNYSEVGWFDGYVAELDDEERDRRARDDEALFEEAIHEDALAQDRLHGPTDDGSGNNPDHPSWEAKWMPDDEAEDVEAECDCQEKFDEWIEQLQSAADDAVNSVEY